MAGAMYAGLILILTTRPRPINERGLLCMGRASRRHTSPLTESNLKSTMAENEEIGLEEVRLDNLLCDSRSNCACSV